MEPSIETTSPEFKRSRWDFILTVFAIFLLNMAVGGGLIGYVLLVFGSDFLMANIPENIEIIVSGFLLGISVSLLYIRELIAFFLIKEPTKVIDDYSIDRLRRKALNLPAVNGIISLLARGFVGIVVASNVMAMHPEQPLRIFTHIFMGIIFSAQVGAIYVYYFAESILSKNVIPFLVKDENVSSIEGVIPFPVYARIGVLILTTAVFPMLHISFLNQLGESQGPVLLYTTVLVFVNGVGQGIFIVKSISLPIGKIAELFMDFKKGQEVNEEIDIYRADDLGRFVEMFEDLTETIEERNFIRQTFGRYMSQEVMEEILNGQIELGGSRMEATVLFTDVRDFTQLAENKPPEEVVKLLNDYLDTMVQIISKNDGIPDKFLGDGILAVWGVPAKVSNHQRKAVNAALEMLEELQKFNKTRKTRDQSPLSIGTGIHSGQLIAGNIGSSKKMEFTVIGDTVNTCSRIESANKKLNSVLSVSETVYDCLKKARQDQFQSVSDINLRGKSQEVSIYTLKDRYFPPDWPCSDPNF